MIGKVYKLLLLVLGFFGLRPDVGIRNILSIGWYLRDLFLFIGKDKKREFKQGIIYPVLGERKSPGGYFSSPYFHQDLYVAQRIFEENPNRHVDIGSRIDGFVTHVASFREIELFDIRKVNSEVENIVFRQEDLMNMDVRFDNYTDSLSSLHVVEHFGLGRYGDEIDPNGHLTGLKNMGRMIKPGGTFYFSTPIGPQRINFNAHRVFSIPYLLELFTKDYKIKRFSYIDDNYKIHHGKDIYSDEAKQSFGCKFGVGILEMEKN